MKYLYFILTFAVLLGGVSYAEPVYPFSMKPIEELIGGRLYVDSSNPKESYFIKSGLLGEDAVVYKYDFEKLTQLSGRSLNNSRIISGHFAENSIFLLSAKSDSLFLNVIEDHKLIKDIYITSSPEATYSNVKFLSDDGNLLLKIGTNLFLFEFSDQELAKIQLLSEECLNFALVKQNGNKYIVFIDDNHENCSLHYVDMQGISLHKQIIPFSEQIEFRSLGNSLVLLFGSSTNTNTLVYAINTASFLVENSFWINSPVNLSEIDSSSNLLHLAYQNGVYSIIRRSIFDKAINEDLMSSNLPKELIEPHFFKVLPGCILIVFKNAVVTLDFGLNIRSIDYIRLSSNISDILEAIKLDDKLIISSNLSSIILEVSDNEFWQIRSFVSSFWKYLIPLLMIFIIIVLFNIIRHQKRLMNTVMDLPATGFMFIIDKSGRLLKLNELARNILSLKENVPLGRQFKYYFKIEDIEPIFNFYENNSLTKETISQRINLIIDSSEKEWLCYIIPIRNIAGANRGVFLTGVDITEQLERKRLTNWAQLAHDMQTNLSTIRLNAEHLDTDINDNNKSRQKKILHQVNVLMQRIRDVITVGRSDSLDLSIVNSADLCNDVRSEFDEVIFPDVQFCLNISNFTFQCDRQKLIRALRNAVENGIRALPNKIGIITISCTKDQKNVYFSIADTGKGMNKDTQRKFLTPYFTTGSTSGGSGIGTMIMLRVAELHGGKLIINSQEGSGTEITFSIPFIKP